MTKPTERPHANTHTHLLPRLRTGLRTRLHPQLRTGPHTPLPTRLHPSLRTENDEGAATAEYVVATMAAVGFAGLLVLIMRSDEVRGMLTDLVRSALTVAG